MGFRKSVTLAVVGAGIVLASQSAPASMPLPAAGQSLSAIQNVYYYRGHYYPYRYHGHYYRYRYNGHYYNHRRRIGGHWRYY